MDKAGRMPVAMKIRQHRLRVPTRLRRLFEIFQRNLEVIPPQLSRPAACTCVLERIDLVLSNQMDALHGSAWTYWVLGCRRGDGLRLLAKVNNDRGRRKSREPFIFHPSDFDYPMLISLSEKANSAIRAYTPQDTANFNTGWEDWLGLDDGTPNLAGRWGLLIATLVHLRYPLERLPTYEETRRNPNPDLRATRCGVHWLEVVEELPRLRWAMDLVAEALPMADKLPEQHVRLQDRWRSQAFTLLEELKIQFGNSLDIPPFQGKPAVVGARLVPLQWNFVADLDERVERMRTLGAALQVYMDAENQSAIPGDQWRSAGWICKGIEEFNAAGEKMTANKLDRLAKAGLIKRRPMKGAKRQWEYQLASICGFQRLRWAVEALKQAFLSESDVARRGR